MQSATFFSFQMVILGEIKPCASCVAVHTNRGGGKLNFEEIPLKAIIRTQFSD